MVKLDKRPDIRHIMIFMAYVEATKVLLISDINLINPVRIYLFKHCLELISRILIDPDCTRHSLKSFSNEIMKRYPVIAQGEDIKFDLTDEEELSWKKSTTENALKNPNLQQYDRDRIISMIASIDSPKINVKQLYEILKKYDFGDKNNTYFRYLDGEKKIGNYTKYEDIVEEIKKDISFIEDCLGFFTYIFTNVWDKIKK